MGVVAFRLFVGGGRENPSAYKSHIQNFLQKEHKFSDHTNQHLKPLLTGLLEFRAGERWSVGEALESPLFTHDRTLLRKRYMMRLE